MELKTERLTLRDFVDSDIAVLPDLINDLEVSEYLAVVPYPYGPTDAEWFVRHCQDSAKKMPREAYELGIALTKTGELIGCIGLTKINYWDGKAILGYWLAKKFWRQGIMYEAIQGILGYAFNELGLQRIDVTTAVENEASNKLIQKLGATFEGVAKRFHRAKSTGQYHDANLYGLLKENWKNKP